MTLEISYLRPDGGQVQKESVFEDCEDEQQPRLLVSLSAVTALKELCEHEHARYDKVVSTLTSCRASYYKELRWLREQLHLAFQTDEEAMVRKANLIPDDFEVYWFKPPDYLDLETQEFLEASIRETSRKLISENTALRTQIQQNTNLQSAVIPTVMRQLRKEHSVGKILREFRRQLKGSHEIAEFEEAVADLVDLPAPAAAHIDHTAAAIGGKAPSPREVQFVPDPAVVEERDALRQKVEEGEALISQLRAQLAQGIDVQLERERADAERTRADLVQKRAERLEAQQRELRDELRETATESQTLRVHTQNITQSLGEKAVRMQRSVSKLSDLLGCLSPSSSRCCSPCMKTTSPQRGTSMSPKRPRRRNSSPDIAEEGSMDEPEATFDEALGHLDDVASGFALMAQEVTAELQELRAKVRALEALLEAGVQRARDERLEVEGQADVERRAAELEATRAAEAAKAAATARADALEKQLAQVRERLEQEEGKSSKLRKDLAEAHGTVEQQNSKLMMLKKKLDKLRAELRALKAERGEEYIESDDDLNLTDFMIPYSKRAACASGKARWELLSEDAGCARRRRASIAGPGPGGFQEEHLHMALHRTAPPVPRRAAEVNAAFRFLSRPVDSLVEQQPVQLLQALKQLSAGQPPPVQRTAPATVLLDASTMQKDAQQALTLALGGAVAAAGAAEPQADASNTLRPPLPLTQSRSMAAMLTPPRSATPRLVSSASQAARPPTGPRTRASAAAATAVGVVAATGCAVGSRQPSKACSEGGEVLFADGPRRPSKAASEGEAMAPASRGMPPRAQQSSEARASRSRGLSGSGAPAASPSPVRSSAQPQRPSSEPAHEATLRPQGLLQRQDSQKLGDRPLAPGESDLRASTTSASSMDAYVLESALSSTFGVPSPGGGARGSSSGGGEGGASGSGGVRSSSALRSAAQAAVSPPHGGAMKAWTPEALPPAWQRQPRLQLDAAGGLQLCGGGAAAGAAPGAAPGPQRNSWLAYQRSAGALPFTNAPGAAASPGPGPRHSRSSPDVRGCAAAAADSCQAVACEFLPTGLPALPRGKGRKLKAAPAATWLVP